MNLPRRPNTFFVTGATGFIGSRLVAELVRRGDAAGYHASFLAGFVISVAGCLALVRALDAKRGPSRLQPVWTAA
jgi:thioester reductase-like protein